MLGWAGRASSNRTATSRKVSEYKKSAVLECKRFSNGKDIAFESTKHSVGGEVLFHKIKGTVK